MNNDNYYDNSDFNKRLEDYTDLFTLCNLDKPSMIQELDDNYRVLFYDVEEKRNSPYIVSKSGSICRLYKDEFLVYEWKCIYHRSLVSNLIKHKNGHLYLVFKIDLYGYSVLEIDTLKVINYLPSESYINLEETFIWGDMHFNDKNNLLAVEGCFWADSSNIILLDFSNPLNIVFAKDWIIVSDYLNLEESCDIEFVKWNFEKLEVLVENKGSYKIDTTEIFI